MIMPGASNQPQLTVAGGDPSQAANQYLDQIPGVTKQYFNPFINQGRIQDRDLSARYKELFYHPQNFYNKIMKGYQPSESYRVQSRELGNEMGNAAAAGGVAGTPGHVESLGRGIHDLLSGDMGDYFKNIMGLYNQGTAGKEHFSDRGYDASKTLADYLANVLSQKGNLAYQSQAQANQSDDDWWNNLIGAGGQLFGGALSGGWFGGGK